MVRVTIKNEESREDAVILVKHEGPEVRDVRELSGGQATTFNVGDRDGIEIVERTKPVTEMDGGSPPAADGGEKTPAA
jgi:hypothetical protein